MTNEIINNIEEAAVESIEIVKAPSVLTSKVGKVLIIGTAIVGVSVLTRKLVKKVRTHHKAKKAQKEYSVTIEDLDPIE